MFGLPAQSLSCPIAAVLGEREGSGTRRRPGIDQAHLDDIESAWCACKPAARLVDLELHPIQYRDRCIVRKVMLQDVDDDRIDLDACYVTNAEEALSTGLHEEPG